VSAHPSLWGMSGRGEVARGYRAVAVSRFHFRSPRLLASTEFKFAEFQNHDDVVFSSVTECILMHSKRLIEHDEWLFRNDGVGVRVPLAAPVISSRKLVRNAHVTTSSQPHLSAEFYCRVTCESAMCAP
jgi:hypothetical protein